MLRYRTPVISAALAVAVLLLALAASAQEPTPDPAAAAAEHARQQAEGPRFVPFTPGAGYVGCTGEPPASERVEATVPPGVDLAVIPNAAGWQVSAPRGPIRPDAAVTLTLRDKAGRVTRPLVAEVVAPDGNRSSATSSLFGAFTAELDYPSAFGSATPLSPGVYTVIWRSMIGNRFIACDGFVVD